VCSFVDVDLAGVNEAEPSSSDVDPVPRLLPEVQTRSVNFDPNAEDTIYLNDDMEIEDDFDIGGIDEFVGSDLFGFRSIHSDAAGPTRAGQQTTSSGNNSVR